MMILTKELADNEEAGMINYIGNQKMMERALMTMIVLKIIPR